MSKWRFDLKVETARFEKQVARCAKQARVSLGQMLIEAAVMYAQSAAKATPPAPGRKIPKSAYKRKIIRCISRFRNGKHENLVGTNIKPDRQKGSPERGDKVRYLIKYRNFRGRFRKWFDSRREALSSRYVEVWYRGVSRAGFWRALEALKKPVGNVDNRSRLSTVAGINRTTNQAWNPLNPKIVIDNRVRGIERYATAAAATGFRKAANRLRFLEKQSKEKIEQEGNRA